jgi:mannosyl-oligosaccharide glucosidase
MQTGNLNLPDITEDSSNIMVYQVTGRGQGNLSIIII